MKSQHNRRSSTKFIEVFAWIPILVLVYGALAGLTYQIGAISFEYPLDYGEAPLVNQAMQLNAGKTIYRTSLDQPPFTIANYPPVYVVLLAGFEGLFGPNFWYGRLLSSLSAFGSAVMIFLSLIHI